MMPQETHGTGSTSSPSSSSAPSSCSTWCLVSCQGEYPPSSQINRLVFTSQCNCRNNILLHVHLNGFNFLQSSWMRATETRHKEGHMMGLSTTNSCLKHFVNNPTVQHDVNRQVCVCVVCLQNIQWNTAWTSELTFWFTKSGTCLEALGLFIYYILFKHIYISYIYYP